MDEGSAVFALQPDQGIQTRLIPVPGGLQALFQRRGQHLKLDQSVRQIHVVIDGLRLDRSCGAGIRVDPVIVVQPKGQICVPGNVVGQYAFANGMEGARRNVNEPANRCMQIPQQFLPFPVLRHPDKFIPVLCVMPELDLPVFRCIQNHPGLRLSSAAVPGPGKGIVRMQLNGQIVHGIQDVDPNGQFLCIAVKPVRGSRIQL